MVYEVGSANQPPKPQIALSYSVKKFEGPLDLLLHLIQKAQVNIYDIPIAEITDQFLAYLQTPSRLDLDDLTEFYAMAAHLIYMKSRLLLPSPDKESDDEEFAELRTNLVERLLEHQKFKRYTTLLTESSEGGELFIQRKKNQFMLPFEDQDLWNDVTVWDLLQAFSSMLRAITPQQVFNVYEEITPKQKLALMAELFETRDEISFMDLIVDRGSALDCICAFLAILEAVKFAMITIHQHALFGDIVIRRKDDFDDTRLNAKELEFEDDLDYFIEPVVAPTEDVYDDDEIIELNEDEDL
ncbi:MAG: segregation/condensation protein A [Sphaerochaetaceae bacterium]|jgi:segregation and condensation protein A|nr:segregation/condensation protein A [Sphaerochaetaceae bacterium]